MIVMSQGVENRTALGLSFIFFYLFLSVFFFFFAVPT